MNTKKALKKLKKKTIKNISETQLAHLKQSVTGNNRISNDFKSLSKNVLSSTISELKTPFMPLLSWFDTGRVAVEPMMYEEQVDTSSKKVLNTKTDITNIAQFPLKSPPCKSCPARKNGLCKCAVKKLAS